MCRHKSARARGKAMKTSILFAVVCALSSAACDISCFGECDDWDDDCSDQHPNGAGSGNAAGASAGETASGGSGATGNQSGGSANSSDSGGTGNSAGKSGNSDAEPKSCTDERDCPRGFNCNYERRECVATDAETCPELVTESACDNRKDCMSIYAGINCSCGADCECVGGEPGCVCQSFEFFACEELKN